MMLGPFQVVVPAVLAAAVLLLVSCVSEGDEKNVSTAYRHGVPGGTWVESYKTPVTIDAIDPASRKVTLVASDSSRTTFTAGPDFKGFEQLRVGDKAEAAVAKELVVFMHQHGLPPAADTSVAKAMIKDGEQSGVLKSETVEKTATITAINSNRGEATLQFADGTTRTVTVRRDVNLWSLKLGDEVVIRTRSAVVLNLEKP